MIEKAAGRAPDETLLVLDATTGQNGIAQARAFTEAVEVTGVALTKLDGTAKGASFWRSARSAGRPGEAGRHRRGGRRPGAVRRRGVRRATPRADVAKADILIVEDHPTMRGAVRMLLEPEGFEIREAADGGQPSRWRGSALRT